MLCLVASKICATALKLMFYFDLLTREDLSDSPLICFQLPSSHTFTVKKISYDYKK